MRIADLHRLALATAVLGSGLLGSAAYLWSLPPRDTPGTELAAWTLPEEPTAAPAAAALQGAPLAEALVRPLFSTTRRPFDPGRIAQAAAPPPPPPPPPDLGEVSLKGVALTPQLQRALIVTPERPDGQWLPVGAEASGWKLIAIDDTGVTLGFGTQTKVLKLYVDKPAK